MYFFETASFHTISTQGRHAVCLNASELWGTIQNRREERTQYGRGFWRQYRHTLKPVSECPRRCTRPGLKGPAERAGRGKTGLTCNVTDVHILLCQQLAGFGDAYLIYELRMRQVLICQPPLQRARADTHLLRDHHQRWMSGRQQPRDNVADFTDWNSGLVHGRYTFRDNPSIIVVTIIAASLP